MQINKAWRKDRFRKINPPEMPRRFHRFWRAHERNHAILDQQQRILQIALRR
jgi:hypothetical protein